MKNVGSQVRSQVRNQVRNQVRVQVRDQVESQVESQVGSQVGSGCNNNRGGSFWAGWCAYVTFFRDVMGWHDPILEKFTIDEELVQSCGWVWWHENVLALSDRPRVLHRNAAGRLHCTDGPAIAYPDGWAIYALNGVAVPEALVMTPTHELNPQLILTEKNAEVRREIVRKIGIESVVQKLGGKQLDQWHDYELLELFIPGMRTKPRYLKMKNPSIGVWHIEGVPPEITTCRGALAWRDGETEYEPPTVLT